MTKRACVLGAGNSAHVVAGLIAALEDWECHVYAPRKNRAELWREGIARGGMRVCYGPDDDNLVIQGAPDKVSKLAEDVVPRCQVLIMCLPAQAYEENIRAAAPYVDHGAMIGTICASNGFDWCIDEAMAKVGRGPDSYGVFALQNLPWACRAEDYGHSVSVLGTKPFMEITVRPEERAEEIAEAMTRLIRVKTPPVPGGFVGVGLSNLCQVIHPVVMYDNFEDWDGETPFTDKPLFYQGLSDEAADNMHAVSDEIKAVRDVLEQRYSGLDLSVVYHIYEWTLRAYGKYITDTSTLRTRFSSNKAYEGLTCPMLPTESGEGFTPDFQARYLSEDIPYNLVAVKGLAELCRVETPTIDKILEWSQKVLGKEYLVDGALEGKDVAESFAPQRFGFQSLDDIPELATLDE